MFVIHTSDFVIILFFLSFMSYISPFNSDGALERAKRSVEQRYAVVGVLEDFNVTLTVFEHYIPRFFKGATDVYYGIVNYNVFFFCILRNKCCLK